MDGGFGASTCEIIENVRRMTDAAEEWMMALRRGFFWHAEASFTLFVWGFFWTDQVGGLLGTLRRRHACRRVMVRGYRVRGGR